MYSMYSLGEMKDYGLSYEFVGIHVKEFLVSYAELYVKASVVEIYNVYTHPSVRGSGYASKLLKLIKTLHPTKNLWLGVRFVPGESPDKFMSKIRLYAKAGFTSEVRLTNKTPSAGKQMPFHFIEMKYKHDKVGTSYDVVTKTLNKAKALITANIQSGGEKHKLYKARFHVTDSYLSQVKHELRNHSDSKEYGGAIQFSYSGFKGGVFTFKGEDAVTKHIVGTGGNNMYQFSTGIPYTNISKR